MTQNKINNSASIFDIDNIRLNGNDISSTDTNGNVVLAPNGTGSVEITTSPLVPNGDRAESIGSSTNSWSNLYCDGLTFNDGTDILSVYTPQTSWTPTIQGAGTTGSCSYSNQFGAYVRVGDAIFITFDVTWSSHTGSGGLEIANLPFTCGTNSIGSVQPYDNITLAGTAISMSLLANSGATTMQVAQQLSGGETSQLNLSSNTSGSLRGSVIIML